MNRKLKALGLALVASLALSIVASSAQAAQFHTSSLHALLSGGQTTEHEFTTGGGFGVVKCKTATFAGTTSTTTTTASEQTVTAAYSNCSDSLGRTVHVDMNTCDYLFTTNALDTFGTVHLNCTAPNDSVTLTVTGGSGSVVCTVHIPPQTLGGITYSNAANGDLLVSVNTGETITSLVTGGFFACGTSTEHQTKGTYKGSTTIAGTATDEKTNINVTIS